MTSSSEEKQVYFKERGLLGRLKRRWLSLRWWHKLLALLACVLLLGATVALVLLIVVLARAGAASTPASSLDVLNSATTPGVDDNRQMQRARTLADSLKIQTVSYGLGLQEYDAILELHEFIKQGYPLVHASPFIQREVVNSYSLLYTVTGSDNGNKLPYLLAAHLDVVPADPATWEVDPFGGEIVNDTFIYGRGAFDDKCSLLGILEALEYMIERGERPKRTFFLAFGHDEEIAGHNGAQEIAKYLQSQSVNKLDFLLDEGSFVSVDFFPGIHSQQVALLGVCEKGSVTLELSVAGKATHSSYPPWESAIGVLSRALATLEEHKLPSVFGSGPEKTLFEFIAPLADFGYRMMYTNFWLFSGLMSSMFESDESLNPVLRTTTALTIVEGGVKENIVPASASAIVNHRVHASQHVTDVLEFDSRVINDPRVHITVKNARDPPHVSPYGPGDAQYQLIATSISQTFQDTIVAPTSLMGSTDAFWYLGFTKRVYRFLPVVMDPEDNKRYHGDNERLSVESYGLVVSFYHRVILNADLVIDYAESDQ